MCNLKVRKLGQQSFQVREQIRQYIDSKNDADGSAKLLATRFSRVKLL